MRAYVNCCAEVFWTTAAATFGPASYQAAQMCIELARCEHDAFPAVEYRLEEGRYGQAWEILNHRSGPHDARVVKMTINLGRCHIDRHNYETAVELLSYALDLYCELQSDNPSLKKIATSGLRLITSAAQNLERTADDLNVRELLRRIPARLIQWAERCGDLQTSDSKEADDEEGQHSLIHILHLTENGWQITRHTKTSTTKKSNMLTNATLVF